MLPTLFFSFDRVGDEKKTGAQTRETPSLRYVYVKQMIQQWQYILG